MKSPNPASFVPVLVAGIILCLPSAASAAVTIDWVTVGDPGNPDDSTNRGGVAYTYQIAKYEVTVGQYTEFLNTKAKTDTYDLYNANMGSDLNIAGISRSGAPGSYVYAVIGSSNRPVTYVSWFDAARFSNWLHNGQGNGDTESGAYALDGAMSGVNFSAVAGTRYRLPTEDEWYKAAYYDGSGGYSLYPTNTDSLPGNTIGAGANQANFRLGGAYSVTQSDIYSASQNYLTDVGAFTSGSSYYGTFDQAGNVWEWNDSVFSALSRGLRGGAWSENYLRLRSTYYGGAEPFVENNETGFRLVAIPEPTNVLMVVMGGVACAARRRRPAL